MARQEINTGAFLGDRNGDNGRAAFTKVNENFAELYGSTRFNVRNYGALGDGAADDTVAIQAAIDAGIATGAAWTVYIPAGTYIISDELDVTQATTGYKIYGDGAKLTWLRPTAFGAGEAVLNLDSYSVLGDRTEPIYIQGIRIGKPAVSKLDPMEHLCPGYVQLAP
jgi:pectin methylesterase-like acyl-CoA thioesterase